MTSCFQTGMPSVALRASSVCLVQFPLVQLLSHIPVSNCALHCWPKGLPVEAFLVCVDYMGVSDVARVYPGYRDVISSKPMASVDEVVYQNS